MTAQNWSPRGTVNTAKCASCGSSVDAVFHYRGSVYCKRCMRKAKEGRP